MNDTRRKEPSQRQLKVGEELRHALSELFMRGDFYDPETRLTLDITISEVRVSPDMRNATVFFIPLGGKDSDRMEDVLNPISGAIRTMMGKKVHMKRLPALHFKLDESFDNAANINSIITKAIDAGTNPESQE